MINTMSSLKRKRLRAVPEECREAMRQAYARAADFGYMFWDTVYGMRR